MLSLKNSKLFIKGGLWGSGIFFVAGLLSYLGAGINYIFSSLITGFIGGILLTFIFNIRNKMLFSAFAVMIAIPLATLIGFGLIEGTCFVVPSFCVVFEETGLPDILAIMIIAFIVNGLYSCIVFACFDWFKTALIGALVSIPFAIIVVLFNLYLYSSEWYLRIFSQVGFVDFNFLVIMISFGCGLGINIVRIIKMTH